MSLIITIMVLECEYCITWNSVQCKLNGIDSCFKGTLFLKLFLLSFYFFIQSINKAISCLRSETVLQYKKL